MEKVIPVNNKISHRSNIKIEAFDPAKRYTRPHRHHKYLELVYFSKGSGYHFMDDHKYPVAPPILFVINKAMVHHWEIDSLPVGYVIIIKEQFLENTLDRAINKQLYAINQLTVIPIEENHFIETLFQLLAEEIKNKASNQTEVLEGLLKALFSKLLNHVNSSEQVVPDCKLSQLDSLLGHKLKNEVNYYARKLHTTPQNLNRICKKEYNKTVSEVIGTKIIKEAKRQLQYTTAPISHVAFYFKFKDVSHFIKYFKRHTGVTPLKYRKNTL
ncbi:helix-turn-helix domain-containing protein [Gramella sp. AN32]|uniref:AraC family transcriptional regulator n=1 Tax=Christiangramia antarctica TaxID=2058158 RepID=A0ABW5X639_9FLAO|nr:helix-turn-helix domain-containing protein [Gramella sp. AN32]MCM4155801.1 AraC family transcriptional regulator [Gramella sp. AN32]